MFASRVDFFNIGMIMDFLKMSGIVAVVIIIEYKLARIIESWGDIAL